MALFAIHLAFASARILVADFRANFDVASHAINRTMACHWFGGLHLDNMPRHCFAHRDTYLRAQGSDAYDIWLGFGNWCWHDRSDTILHSKQVVIK